MRLDRYCKENEGTLFVTEGLKKAVDDIYKFPLKEFARDTLNRQLKAGLSDEDASTGKDPIAKATPNVMAFKLCFLVFMAFLQFKLIVIFQIRLYLSCALLWQSMRT